MKDFGNLDGELTEDFLNIGGETPVGLIATSATQNVYPNMNDDFMSFDADYFSDATGRRRRKPSPRKKQRLKRKQVRQKSRLDTRKSKNAERLARAELTKSLTKDKKSDIELAKALSSSEDKVKTISKKPMSTTTKVLIGTGIFAGVALISFILYKKLKK